MKDSISNNGDEENSSFLTMSYTVSETAHTKSKASQIYNMTKKSKRTNDNVDFVLSPSEGSMPNATKIVGNLLHSYKDSGSIEFKSMKEGSGIYNNDKSITTLHHTNNSVEMPLPQNDRMPFSEIPQTSKVKMLKFIEKATGKSRKLLKQRHNHIDDSNDENTHPNAKRNQKQSKEIAVFKNAFSPEEIKFSSSKRYNDHFTESDRK